MALEQWLIDRATVYTADPTSGLYSIAVRTELRCRLVKISTDNAGTARAELLASRRLVWDKAYAMPAYAQVEVAGARWNFVEGTIATYRDKRGNLRYRAADVVGAESG